MKQDTICVCLICLGRLISNQHIRHCSVETFTFTILNVLIAGIAAEASEPEASERRSRSNLCFISKHSSAVHCRHARSEMRSKLFFRGGTLRSQTLRHAKAH